MRAGIRIAIASAALTAGLALTGASQAQAQVAFHGSFPVRHGRVSIGIGHPRFRVGTYVPRGYRVYQRPSYGYGFAYRDRWIPVRRYRSQWMICERPYVVGDAYAGGYGYGGGYGDDRNYRRHRCDDRCDRNDSRHRGHDRYDRDDNRNDGRRYDQDDDRYDDRRDDDGDGWDD
jgi:hypothetical protein